MLQSSGMAATAQPALLLFVRRKDNGITSFEPEFRGNSAFAEPPITHASHRLLAGNRFEGMIIRYPAQHAPTETRPNGLQTSSSRPSERPHRLRCRDPRHALRLPGDC